MQQFHYRNSKLNIVTEDENMSDQKLNLIGVRMSGYKNDRFGLFVKHSMVFMSIFWMLIFAILIGDYYGVFYGINYRDQAMLLVDRKTLSIAFIIVWNLTALWFVTLYLHSTNLLTYFLAEELLEYSDFVLIEKKMDVHDIVESKKDWIFYVLKLETLFRSQK